MEKFLFQVNPNATQNASKPLTAVQPEQSSHSRSCNGDTVSDADSDSNEALAAKRKKRKTNNNVFKQKFKKSWINESNNLWLIEDSDKACCKICHTVIQGGITHVNRHGNSSIHIQRMKALKATPSITNVMNNSNKEKKLRQGIKEGELKMILFLAEHNLSFNILEHLPKFISSVCYDSEVAKNLKCSRTKGTSICTHITGPENLKNVSNDLKVNWYSLIIDECTDISTEKSLTVIVCYFGNNSVRDKFLGLTKLQNSTAEGLFQVIKCLLIENNIPLSKLVGFAADNAAVMQGNKNSVKTKFSKEVSDIYVLGCTCHSLALCSSAACQKLPTSVETLARDIVSYFAHSSKRQDEFKLYQHFLNIAEHKLLKLSGTRWLSLQAVVDRILEQWQALLLFFTNETYDKCLSINPPSVVEALQNPIFKLYFSFLSYILDIVNKINIEFQSESSKLHLLYYRTTSLFKTVLKNFLKREYLEKVSSLNKVNFQPENYNDIDKIYYVAKCEIIIYNLQNVNMTELRNFKITCLDFYIELARQIQSRFDFDDEVLHFLKNLDPVSVTRDD